MLSYCFRYFTNPDAAKYAKEALLKELEEEDSRSITAGAPGAAEPPEKAPRMEAAAPSSKSSLMKEFDQILEESEDPGAATSSGPAVELHGYFAEKTIATSDSPYQYWGVNRHRLPGLAAAVTKYLCAPCTSVESERLFSTVSDTLDDKRNRLTAERAEMLVFTKKNLPLLLCIEDS